MVHSCPVTSRSRTSLYPTVVRVITVMYRASVKLQPSNTMYPNTPATVIVASAKRAPRIRLRATRGSYTVLSESDRSPGRLSAMDGIIVSATHKRRESGALIRGTEHAQHVAGGEREPRGGVGGYALPAHDGDVLHDQHPDDDPARK